MKRKVKFYFIIVLVSLILAGCATGTASLPKKQMTGPQLKSLLEAGKDLKLGDPRHGYHGELRLNPDGTGKGQALANSGKEFKPVVLLCRNGFLFGCFRTVFACRCNASSSSR